MSPHNLSAYLPGAIVDWYRSHSAEGVHRETTLEGVLICVDASGFTELTRQLSTLGRDGPEHLTILLNGFFEGMSKVVFGYNGDVLKFAGDAFWAYFPDEFSPQAFLSDALIELELINSASEITRKDPLTIHIGGEFGKFALVSLGEALLRLEAEPIGKLVESVFRACDEAGTNQFVIGPELARRTDSEYISPHEHSSFSLVVPAPGNSDKFVGAPSEFEGALDDESLSCYIPSAIATRIVSSGSSDGLQSEHRDVVALFANFEFDNCNELSDSSGEFVELNAILERAFTIAREFGGSVARIDPYGQGHKLLLLFGAPIKQERDELKSISCANQLLKLHSERFRIRIGLARGQLFCGDVGARRRREYTVMGEGANMAARLMAHAGWGKSLLDQELRDSLPEHIRTERRELSLKGIGSKIPSYELLSIDEQLHQRDDQGEIVGLSAEFEQLSDQWNNAKDGVRRTVSIIGDTGVGKTILVKRFAAQFEESRTLYISGHDSILHGHGWLMGKVLTELYVRSESGQVEDFRKYINETVGEKWQPLFSEILKLDIEDNLWTRDLSGELRIQKTRALLALLIKSMTKSAVAVIIDDCDSVDEYSLSLLSSVEDIESSLPLLLIIVSRDNNTVKSAAMKVDIQIKALSPSKSEWEEFFARRFIDGKRERELCAELLNVTNRNPHLIMEFIADAVRQGSLEYHEVSGKWSLASSDAALELPKSHRDAQLSHFDRLSEKDRDLLKIASISSGPVSSTLLFALTDESHEDDIESRLADLRGAGILNSSGSGSGSQFVFRNTSMRDAIYSCIPSEKLASLHSQYAAALRKNSEKNAGALAFHYENANENCESFHFSLKAAEESFRLYSLTEAGRFFRQCRTILDERDKDELELADVFTFYQRYCSSLALEGRYSEIYPVLREWRRLGKSVENECESIDAALESARTLWRQSKYARSRTFASRMLASEKIAEYKEGLSAGYLIMSDIERRMGNFCGAQEWCEKSIELSIARSDSTALSDAHNRMGLCLWGGGELERAAESFNTSLTCGKESQGKYAQARTQNNLGIINFSLGKYMDSEKLLAMALEIFNNIGDIRNEAYASGNLANVSRILGKFTRSRELFQQADVIFQKLGDMHAHNYTVGNIGDIDVIEGDWKSAEEKFNQVTEFAESVGDKELSAECQVRFGEIAFFTNDIRQAENRYLEAIKDANNIGSKEWFIRGATGLARLYIGERRDTEALELIEKILFSARETKAAISESEAIFLSGEYYRITNRNEEAATRFKSALKYAQSNGVFELAFKSAIRIYETISEDRETPLGALNHIIDIFIKQNSARQWSIIAQSGYFSYFSEGLKKALKDKRSQKSPDFHPKV